MALTLYTDIGELITNAGVARKGGAGIVEEDLGIVRGGALLWDSRAGVRWLGKATAVPKALARGAKRVSLKDRVLCPALADCHTHSVFGGSRHHELKMRLDGATYQQIAAAGGGIVSTVKATRAASEAELYESALERALEARSVGVGILEMKSGYGLDWPNERKLMRVATRLKDALKSKLVIKSTFLGAHAFPPGTQTAEQREAYVDEIVDKMIPATAREGLADACDVFFDEGYYDEKQSRRIMTAAATHGLAIKFHADELANTGGARLAAEFGAQSADHLLRADDDGLKAMAQKGVVAVLLPTTAFYLGLPYAPIVRMRKAGVCLALATDFNPGTSPGNHLPFVMSLACMQMGLTMPEAFAAATYGGARALGLHEQHGSLVEGRKPKLAIFRVPSYEALISQYASLSLCEAVL